MIKLEHPNYRPAVRIREGREQIFDSLRRKWLVLTPEEWVRQYFISYLLHVMQYPPAWIAVEKLIRVNGLRKRFDAVVYGRDLKPLVLVECKQMGEELNETVIRQLLQYNLALKAGFLVATNGKHCLGFDIRSGTAEQLMELPDPIKLFGPA